MYGLRTINLWHFPFKSQKRTLSFFLYTTDCKAWQRHTGLDKNGCLLLNEKESQQFQWNNPLREYLFQYIFSLIFPWFTVTEPQVFHKKKKFHYSPTALSSKLSTFSTKQLTICWLASSEAFAIESSSLWSSYWNAKAMTNSLQLYISVCFNK